MTTGPVSGPTPFNRQQLQTRAVSGALWTLLHVAVSLPIAFLVNILLARILGVEDFGRLAYLTMVMEIVSVVVMLGVGAGLTQFGAKAHSRGDLATVQSLLSGTQGFRVIVGAPILTGVVVVMAQVPLELLVLAVLFGIWIPAAFGGGPAALTIQNDTARAARLAMVINLLTQAAIVAALFSAPKPDIIWSVRLVMAGLGIILAVFLVRREYRRAVLRPRWPSGLPSGFWRYAIPMGLTGIVATVALNRSEVVLLERLSTAEQVGLYAMAFGLAGHLFAPAQALLAPLTPAISALREVEVGAIKEAFRRTVRLSNAIAGLIVAIGAPVLALLVPTIYGRDFESADTLVLALVMVSGFLIVTYPMQTFVTARLRAGSTLAVNALSLVVMVVVAVLLIPWVGAWGAVLGKVGVVLARIAWLSWREIASFMVSRSEFLLGFRHLLAASLVGGASYCVGTIVLSRDDGGLVEGIGAALVFSVLSWLAMLKLIRGGLLRSDVEAISRSLPARARGPVSSVVWILIGRRA